MGRKGVMVAAGLLAVATPLGAWAAASAPDAGCQAVYKVVTQWPGGFIGNVTVTNAGSAVNGWTVGFGFPSSQRVLASWNATHSQSGASVTLRSMSWNASLPADGSASIGFVGT